MTRTEGDINYKKYAIKPTVSSDLRSMALTLAKSGDLKSLEVNRVVEQPRIPGPGFEKFRIIFRDRIRGGAHGIWNSGSIAQPRTHRFNSPSVPMGEVY